MTIRGFLVLAACLSCLGGQAASSTDSQDPAPTADDPPPARALVQSAAGDSVVYAYYFHQTFRCFTCQSMEEMAARTIQEHFAPQVQAGRVVWMPVNIDKPEGKVLRQQFDARATDLVLAHMEGNVCKESRKLEELAGFLDRPDAFSKYLVDQISAYLSPVLSR
jgi:hypothetical protein